MTSAIDLAALPPSIVVPGIAAWLGTVTPDPDEGVESYEDFLNRLSGEGQCSAS